MKVIDLSHEIYDDMPHYSTDPPVKIKQKKNIKNNGSVLHSIELGTHTGTHLDVPQHIMSKGKSLNDYNPSKFFGKAVKVTLQNYQDILDKIVDIDAILVDTGWSTNYVDPDVFYGSKRPSFPLQFIEKCISKNIKIFGCDLPSVDSKSAINKPVHNNLLINDIIIYENLTNLDKISSGLTFMFYGFPLPFKELDGSPVRAVAVLD